MNGQATIAFYCQCGGTMTGTVGPASRMPDLESAFWSVHKKSACGPATKSEARAARRRRERLRARPHA